MITGFQLKGSTWHARLPILVAFLLWMGIHSATLTFYFNVFPEISLWDSFVFNSLVVGCILVLSTITPRFPKAGVFQLALGSSILLTFLAQWVGSEILKQLIADQDYQTFLSQGVPVRLALIFFMISGSGLAFVFYSRWRDALDSKSLTNDAALMARDAELKKLQQQLQPHFLFNSLNSINALIMVDGKKAQQMVQQLSDFLRVTIRRADQPWIYLAQEMEYLNLYLAIEKVRFGHRLNVNLTVSDESLDWPIPTLVLQPLLENAIKFGLYGTTDETTIELHADIKNKELIIRVSNPFDDDMQPTSGSGFGISGLKRRLYLIFTRNDLLITHAEENIFTVTLTLPPFPNYESIAN